MRLSPNATSAVAFAVVFHLLLSNTVAEAGCLNLFKKKPSCIYNTPPTAAQMQRAMEYMADKPDSTVFDPTAEGKKWRQTAEIEKYGAHVYVKDQGELWHVDGGKVGEGVQGCVKLAWRVDSQASEQPGEAFILKIVEVNHSEKHTRTNYANEITVLRALGRLQGSGKVLVGPSQDDGRTYPPAAPCRPQSHHNKFGTRCAPGTNSYFFQTFFKGSPLLTEHWHTEPWAVRVIREGLQEEIEKLHALGWAHHDIHLSNVLAEDTFDEDGLRQVKVHLIDFGFATYVDHTRDLKTYALYQKDFLRMRDMIGHMVKISKVWP